MTNHERRHSVALDECFRYCQLLESKSEPPKLYKLCNAIRTLDLALSGEHEDSPISWSLCTEAWSRVRDSLFNILISSFAGSLEIYDRTGNIVEPGGVWPHDGTIEFHPDRISRRNDSYPCSLDRLSPVISTAVRVCFAESKQHVAPGDFVAPQELLSDADDDDSETAVERMYEVCQEEATEGKKKAHRKWWQLYWEASSCPNKRQRHALRKQMVALEGLWGKPT